MITGYFGVPGCGKTTFATKIALKAYKNKSYKHIYTNFYTSFTERISWVDLASFKYEDSLLIFDELTLDCDARDYKSMNKSIIEFLILHRHLGCDIIYFTQDFSRVDKTVRNLTFDLWYLQKSIVPGLSNFSYAKRIFRNVNINEYTSELTMGYRFAGFLERLFGGVFKYCYRPFMYKYFDSFDEMQLAERSLGSSVLWEDSPSKSVRGVPLPHADTIGEAETISLAVCSD